MKLAGWFMLIGCLVIAFTLGVYFSIPTSHMVCSSIGCIPIDSVQQQHMATGVLIGGIGIGAILIAAGIGGVLRLRGE